VGRLVLDLLNEQRRQAGVRPLKPSPRLRLAARARAQDMARRHYFSHTTPDGMPWWRKVEQVVGRTGWATLGENIARGQDTPSEVVIAWMRSPEHRANVLAHKYTHAAIAVARRGREEYWALTFGGRS
jgi:uncharacterized protein YkwD